MMKPLPYRVAAAASCFALLAGPALATTLEPVTVADVTRVDDLGFACIEEADLEMAYAATGKKDGLLPRTCLPKPCVELVSPDELARAIGRDPTEAEWADYVSRYSELCVAETRGAWPEDVMFANASAPVTEDTFWSGIGGPFNSGVGSDVVAGVPGGAGTFTPGIVGPLAGGIAGIGGGGGGSLFIPTAGVLLPIITPGFGGRDDDGGDGSDGDDGRDGTDGEDGESGLPGTDNPGTRPPGNPGTPPPPVTPIPLPASMILLLGALGVTWGARRFSKPS